MSSSRIIKSVQSGSVAVSDFTFRPIAQGAPPQQSPEPVGGFVPLAIFDPSEMNASDGNPENAGPPEITLTEDEFGQRLHDSFQQGLQEGKELAERGLLNVFRSLRAASEGVHALREKVLRESEDELIELVMLIARKVILREVNQDRRILSSIVHAGIAALSDTDEIAIRLNPEDHHLVTTNPNETLQNELITDRMRLKADPGVAAGGCLIDTEMGTLDAGIEAQLEEIYRRLLEERSSSAGSVA